VEAEEEGEGEEEVDKRPWAPQDDHLGSGRK